jgi:hypothetical protein
MIGDGGSNLMPHLQLQRDDGLEGSQDFIAIRIPSIPNHLPDLLPAFFSLPNSIVLA